MLRKTAQLADNIGQGMRDDALQLIFSLLRDMAPAGVVRLNCAFHQRHGCLGVLTTKIPEDQKNNLQKGTNGQVEMKACNQLQRIMPSEGLRQARILYAAVQAIWAKAVGSVAIDRSAL